MSFKISDMGILALLKTDSIKIHKEDKEPEKLYKAICPICLQLTYYYCFRAYEPENPNTKYYIIFTCIYCKYQWKQAIKEE